MINFIQDIKIGEKIMENIIMDKNLKKLIFIFSIISFFAFSGVTGAMATVNITLNPSIPSQKEYVVFTAIFSDNDNIENVRIIVEECKEGLCYTDNINESMTKNDENTYEKQITLKHSDATFIKYYVEFYDDGNFVQSEIEQVDLEKSSSNGKNNVNNTPGFEAFFIIIAISLIFLFTRKKRF
jgi:hypothetical protein